MGHVTLDVSHAYSCEVIKATSANRNCTLTPRCRLAPMEVSSQKGGGGRDAALTIELLLLLTEPNGACFEEKSFSRSAAKRVPVSVSQCCQYSSTTKKKSSNQKKTHQRRGHLDFRTDRIHCRARNSSFLPAASRVAAVQCTDVDLSVEICLFLSAQSPGMEKLHFDHPRNAGIK